MEYTNLGRLDIQVSRICFGCWQAHGWDKSDDQNFTRLVREALDGGITFFDTAEAYGNGHSEKLLGVALSGVRQDAVIASKFPFHKAKPAQIRSSLESTLRNLKTDYLDLYQQHWPPKSPPLEDSIAELEKLRDEGKIRAVGVSNWMEPEWEEFGAPGRIETLQPCYSLLWRSIERTVLPLCKKHNIAVIPYSPLCQGILAGRFTDLEDIPNDPRKQNRLLKEDVFPEVQKVLAVIDEISKRVSRPWSAVALRWLLDREGVTSVIAGVTASEQLNSNFKALGWKLTEEDFRALDEISWPLSKDLKPHDSLWNWHPKN